MRGDTARVSILVRVQAVVVEVLLCGIGEQERLLRDGRADVALLHRPFDTTAGLDVEELYTEGQVVVLPAGHPLTGRDHVTTAEIGELPGLPLPRWPEPGGTYPDGPGPQVRDDLTTVPVRDAPAVTTVIAWPPHSRSGAVAGLVRTATRL